MLAVRNRVGRHQGFALVEVMVAVVVLAILLALAMPSFQTFIRNAQIRTATESMQAGLHLARTEALRRNTRVSLWLVNGLAATCARSNTGSSWVVSLDDPAGSCNEVPSEADAPRLIQSRSGNDGSAGIGVTAINAALAAATCITFNGFGRTEATCIDGGAPIAQIDFASATPSTRALRLLVSPGGAIRSCDPGATSGSASAC